MPKHESKAPGPRRCGNCEYRVDQTYECRRWPPTAVVVGQNDRQRVEYRWPMMEDNDWCGEFRARRGSAQNDPQE